MSKKILIISAAIILTIGGAGIFGVHKFQELNHPYIGINPQSLPSVVTDNELAKHHSDLEMVLGFSGKDLSEKDMSKVSLEAISKMVFDEKTKWPEESKLPKGFNAKKFMDIGKNPGLNLSKIHEKGITGKGVTVAVIDKPIISTHNELKDRMTYVKIGDEISDNNFHGLACASILAGKTCGVAPDAKLYYFGSSDTSEKRFSSFYSKAIDKIIEINRALSQKEKIKIVSISDGFQKFSGEEWEKWQETIKRANNEGIIVVYSDLLTKKKFTSGGCSTFKDRNNPSNYELNNYIKGSKAQKDKSWILVPANFRTTASNNGDDQYVHYAEGGFSWAIPYVTGMVALAWQVNPNLSFEEIINTLIDTKTTASEGRYIINPEAFIEAISKNKYM